MSYPLQSTDVPLTATHPGDLLKDEMEERGLTQQQLAEKLSVSQPLLSEIINHKRRVSLEMALKLEETVEIPAETWLNLQKRYDFVTAYHRHQKALDKINVPTLRKEALLAALI